MFLHNFHLIGKSSTVSERIMEAKSKRLREFFEITKIAKKFDKTSGKFNISIRYKTATVVTSRTLAVAEAFGIGVDEHREQVLYDNAQLKIGPKDIVYLTGESGSGKSVLLKRLERLLAPQVINIRDVKVDRNQPLIDTVGKTLGEGLELLSRVGLNDAFLFVRRYGQLSDGQKYRYRIAKLIETNRQYWVMDEFCATLDRDTAKIVAFNVQKLARQHGKAVIAATTHEDLFEDLKPSVFIRKRLGQEVKVQYFPNEINETCSMSRQIRVEEGSIKDYHKLAQFHYREAGRLPPPRRFFALKRLDEIIGVIVYSYSPVVCFGRKNAFQRRLTVQELNSHFSIISRVVLHPKYRTIGLGAKLVKETLPLAGTPYIEAVAVMARYNPFFERAGMKKIVEQAPDPSCLGAVEKLRQLGFNPVLLASERHNLQRLREMSLKEVKRCKKILAEIRSPRLQRAAVAEKPYSNMEQYQLALEKAGIEKIARILRVLSILVQTKVYLLWKNLSMLQQVNCGDSFLNLG